MFNWLHLTDLHWGLTGQSERFSNIEKSLFDDLRKCANKAGPWNAVFFTGDLVQKGQDGEYKSLDRGFLARLRTGLQRHAGLPPLIFAVPGNHDVDRGAVLGFDYMTKGDSPGKKLLDGDNLNPDEVETLTQSLFTKPIRNTDLGCAIDAAFANYMKWWRQTWKTQVEQFKNVKKDIPFGDVLLVDLDIGELQEGWLPGDYSVTVTTTVRSPRKSNERPNEQPKDQSPDRRLKVGIVGLNSTYVQIAGGNYRGKLMLHPLQLFSACGNKPADQWVAEHDACVLLTHQGAEWMTRSGQENLRHEINPPGQFALHLYGHEHVLDVQSRSALGGPSQSTWQGASLFGMERSETAPNQIERRHGHAFGRIDIDASVLRLWPRQIRRVWSRGWTAAADHDATTFEGGDEHIELPLRSVRPVAWRAMTLEAAQNDLLRELQQTYADDLIEIRHLGLDMARAREKFATLFENLQRRRIEVKLLTLAPEETPYPGGNDQLPPSFRNWLKNVPGSVTALSAHLSKAVKAGNGAISVEARHYAELPSIHGFSLEVKSPTAAVPAGGNSEASQTAPTTPTTDLNGRKSSRRVLYFSLCRWVDSQATDKQAEFAWGEGRYWKITEQQADALAKDMLRIYDGAFRHLWNSATETWYKSVQQKVSAEKDGTQPKPPS